MAKQRHPADVEWGQALAHREFRERLARNMKRLRAMRGYSQVELAKRSDLSVSTINRVERATANTLISTMKAVVTGLGCTFAELLN